jgi:hypothetical protein
MLAFLHTARAHTGTFDRLVREIDAALPVRHEVEEQLLAEALAAGTTTNSIRDAATRAVRRLASEGAKLIVVTCSTIGGVAETTPVGRGLSVMRIDRPMAEQAVKIGRRIVVVASVGSTLGPTTSLLRQVASDSKRSVEIFTVLCEEAWPRFEAGDMDGYARDIASAIEASTARGDVIVLAQASMAPAAELVAHLGIPVLTSPALGVRGAIEKYRAILTQQA